MVASSFKSIFAALTLVSSTLVSAEPASGKLARAARAERRELAARANTYTSTVNVYTTVTVTATAATESAAAATASASATGSVLANFVDPTVAFTDGVYACSDFPSDQQGVVAVDWMNLGGWTGIQLTSGDGSSCTEGAYCSYACQPGMSKTQWPSTQPSDGESRGGLICTNGLLYRTNTVSNYLCEWGEQTGFVVSSLSGSVAICRTDYPGTENMVVPTVIGPGDTQPLSVVDEETYYDWEGKMTSSQYYVNNMGVSEADGCIWSTAGTTVGNWAPMVWGAGYTDGTTWLSLFPNPLADGAALNYNVEIVACDSSSTINGDCTYIDGVYSGGANGCTVAVTAGSGCFKIY